jgi:cell division protein FtsQ
MARRRSAAARRTPRRLDRLLGWMERVHPWMVMRSVGLLALFGAFGLVAYRLLDVPVTQVTLEGPFRRVSNGQLEEVLRGQLPAGFLSADLAGIREAVEAVPWVDVARVRRIWPDGVLVSVTEHVAVARWGDDGLLNARGELFIDKSRHVPAELPALRGTPGSEGEVSERYLDYAAQLEPLGLSVLALEVDARGAWRIRLRGSLPGGVEVRLGRENPDERMRRFVDAASGLVRARGERIEYVDMRYGNGFAVGWIDPAAQVRGS